MSKVIFKPVSIVSGLLSGVVGKKLFDLIWRLIDKEDAPRPEYRRINLPKLALALATEGALFKAVRGLVDHASREGFARVTGSWPGEQGPERADEPDPD